MLLGFVATVAMSWAPADVEVQWTTEVACVQVERLSGLLVDFGAGSPSTPIVLSATPLDVGWEVGVGFEDVTRSVRGEDCGLLTEAVALIVAVRVDPVATAATIVPAFEAPAQLEPPPSPAALVEDPPDPLEAPLPPAPIRASPPPVSNESGRAGGTAALRVGGDLGALPRGAVDLGLSGGVLWRQVRIEAGAAALLGPDTRRRELGVRAVFRVFSGLLRGCYVLDSASVEVPICGGVEVGVMQGRARGLTAPNDVDALWLAPVGGVSVGRATGRVRPAGFFQIAFPLRRHTFESDDVGVLHRVPVATVRLGFELRFAWER